LLFLSIVSTHANAKFLPDIFEDPRQCEHPVTKRICDAVAQARMDGTAGKLGAAKRSLRTAVKLIDKLFDPPRIAPVVNGIIRVQTKLGLLGARFDVLHRGIERLHYLKREVSIDGDLNVFYPALNLAKRYAEFGDRSLALHEIIRLEDLLMGDVAPWEQATILGLFAMAYVDLGFEYRATNAFRKSLEISRTLPLVVGNDTFPRAVAFDSLSYWLAEVGRYDEALEVLRELEALRDEYEPLDPGGIDKSVSFYRNWIKECRAKSD